MRVLLLLRGAPGCGKSTWIGKNGLKEYTLSADDLRLLCASPAMTKDGNYVIDSSNDKFVWKTLFNILELRMRNGDFTVIDATNSTAQEMRKYKKISDEYKYRVFCADFTDIPIETAKERNMNREPLRRVPEQVIDRMYSRFKTQNIPGFITRILPDELDKIWIQPRNFDEYKKIHVIGDIHGCYTALDDYFEEQGGIKEDELYIFLGDYLDRGIENDKVMKFFLSVFENKNFILLEGNHEKYLWNWANENDDRDKKIYHSTSRQLDNAEISKKDVRRFYRKLGQCAYFTYGNNTYIVTHGGLSTLPESLTLVSAKQMIDGVGEFDDFEKIANEFEQSTSENTYQIYGHRNTKDIPIKVNDRVFNLEGKIEYGGELRCVTIEKNKEPEPISIKNNVFNIPKFNTSEISLDDSSIGDVVESLRHSPYILEKRFGNISSFNFNRIAFYDKVWDAQTVKARGLYIDTVRQKVVARAYDKFFNVDERLETQLKNLQHSLQFPVTAYVKENGFLGIVSYNADEDTLFITTKTNPNGSYAHYFEEILRQNLSEDSLEELKSICRDEDVSFVFECVDIERDPHIIDYNKSGVYLLDIVKNNISFEKYDYNDMQMTARKLGLKCKTKAFVLEDWKSFYDWYKEVTKDNYRYNGRLIEGFVLEDSNNYMVKLKLQYYKFWKRMRSLADDVFKKGNASSSVIAGLKTPLANTFYGWIKNRYASANTDKESISELRKLFLESPEGKQYFDECAQKFELIEYK